MRIVGVGERGPRYAAAKTHVVKLAAQRAQTRFYVAQAVAISQLCERHRQILVPTGEAARPGISAVASHTTAELAIREETHQLRENGSALVHGPLCDPSEIRFQRGSERSAVQIAAS